MDPSLTDEELEPIIAKYRQVAEEHGAEVDQAGKWEKRRLAYEVKGRREGTYILMNFRAEAAAAQELERLLKLDEAILRHIIVRQEPGKSQIIRLDKLADVRQPEAVPEEAPAQEMEAEVEVAAEAETEPVAEPAAETEVQPETEAPATEEEKEPVE